eukprot:gnl/Hemi2/2503_TR885_c0_g1_i1.p1 gnl/Hemi2/2503_TR885_c0_g1~~gnl/Hemi2/2503_TR885_c0_g1_i1.p1  ORF type:complete len:107 (+),score=21.33 gnl/Hemi2/2503_TR885_c0_g1_i1:45-323(+)
MFFYFFNKIKVQNAFLIPLLFHKQLPSKRAQDSSRPLEGGDHTRCEDLSFAARLAKPKSLQTQATSKTNANHGVSAHTSEKQKNLACLLDSH